MNRFAVLLACLAGVWTLVSPRVAVAQSYVIVPKDLTVTYGDAGVQVRLPAGDGVVIGRSVWTGGDDASPIEETVLAAPLFESKDVLEKVFVVMAISNSPFAGNTSSTLSASAVLGRLGEAVFRVSDHESSYEVPAEATVAGLRVFRWQGGGKDDYGEPFFFQAVLFPDREGRLAMIAFRLEGATAARIEDWSPRFAAAIESLRPLPSRPSSRDR